MSTNLNTEVLIIGGGPTGMVAAIYLDLLGISSIVIERRAKISTHPKAHELSARSIEILMQLGISMEDLLAEAAPYEEASRIAFCHEINSVIGDIDLRADEHDQKYKKHLAASHPYLNISQTALEIILRKRLLDCNHSKFFGAHQWESMNEDEISIHSNVINLENDTSLKIKSQYLICADGAGSRSRKSLGIEMIGADKINDFLSVYFENDLSGYVNHHAKLYWIFHPDCPGTMIAHHISRRWVCLLYTSDAADD